jgi:transposase
MKLIRFQRLSLYYCTFVFTIQLYLKKKSSSQFIDFINKVDSLCDPSIKQVFIVLDNASIHRSKKTKEAMKKKHPRIVLVFL